MKVKPKLISRCVYVPCDCINLLHFIDLENDWVGKEFETRYCETCGRPLILKDSNGKFYFVGKEVKTCRTDSR